MTAKRKIDDAGKKIGGARKDRWRDRAMTVDDLADLNPEEAGKFVSKDLVWPVDYAALVEAGMPAGVAALVKQCRDRMAAKPALNRYGAGTRELRDADAVRRDYVKMTGIARDVFEACRTEGDVARAGASIRTAAGVIAFNAAPPDAQNLLWTVFKDRSYPFDVGYDERRRAAKLVAEGFPGDVPAWRKGVTLQKWPDGTFVAVKARSIISRGHATEEAAFEAVKAAYDAARADKSKEPVIPVRPHLDEVSRTGLPDRRDGRSVDPDEFIQTFGFAGVEFGNWLPQDERQRVMDMAYDALLDLADVLEVDPKAISFGGVMSLAFGARGSGRAAAHYEPAKRVFNLTRLSGAGSLAHEWAHGFDHMAGEMAQAEPGRGDVRSGSGWREWTSSRKAETAHLGEEASKAWDALLLAFRRKPLTREQKVAELRQNGAKLATTLSEQRTRLADYLAKHPEGERNRKFVKELGDWCSNALKRATTMAETADAFENGSDEGDFGSVQTSYMTQALALSGKLDGYFCRPTEMFARAFECMVYDRLQERGMRSEYLVHGVDEGVYDDPMFKGDPYPAGEERKAIARAMELMIGTMRPHLEAQVALEAEGPRP